jgi:hypothetical protein
VVISFNEPNMMRKVVLLSLGTLCLASAGATGDAWVDEARRVATSVPPKLLAVLSDEIARGGPESAIGVCRDKAPEMARNASAQSGWQIRRVSLRNRNPMAVPDAWERAMLEDFDRRAAAGEAPAALEKAEVVAEGDQRFQRYMRALPTQELCLQCHGTPDRLSGAVKAKLDSLYPQDRATGYSVGQIRGAMTIKKPL